MMGNSLIKTEIAIKIPWISGGCIVVGYREKYIMKLPKGTELAIRKALKISYSASEVKRILMRTQAQYNAFIREAPAPGGMNILRPQLQ